MADLSAPDVSLPNGAVHPAHSRLLSTNIDAHLRRWNVAPYVDVADALPAHGWRHVYPDDPNEQSHAWLERNTGGRPLPETVCVIGAGLGFVVDAIVERSESRVLVLEPEPSCVPWFFARRDWEPLIASGRLLVLAGPEFHGAQHAWRLFGDGEADPLTLVDPVLGRAHPDVTRRAGQVIGRARQGARGNEEARKKFAVPYLINTLRNASVIARAPSVESLFGRYHATPIVLAAAGPSLNRNIAELRPWRDRVILVAVDTALKPLLAANMAPDFVVALDPSDANARHLTNIEVPTGTSLVAEASIAPTSFAAFGDRVFIFRVADHAPWPWLKRMGFDRGTLRAWGSVVTSAFDLAFRMGGDPIVFIGTDLAYTGGQLYARGTTYEQDWAITAGPDRPIEWVWQQVVASRSTSVPSIGGAETPTTKGLMAFRDWLVDESMRPQMPRLVNATGSGILEGGGIALESLDELARREWIGSGRPSTHAGSARQSVTARPKTGDRFDFHLLDVLMTTYTAPEMNGGTHLMPYRQRPRRERVAATESMRAARVTDLERWREPANLDPSWERRARVVSRLIPPLSRVLDLGAGREDLAAHLPEGCVYTPADLVARSPRTVVVDVNKGEFPDGTFDVIATLGVLEYVHDLPGLLARVRASAPMLAATYCARTSRDRTTRPERGWVNEWSLDELVQVYQKSGWDVRVAERLDVAPGFDQWVFALARRV